MTVQATNAPNSAWCTATQVLALPWFAALRDQADAQLADFCAIASAWLWRATGRQFPGPATTTVRPVPRYSWGPLGSYRAETFDSRTGRYGWATSSRSRCEGAEEVLLGHTPVRSVAQVVIDGAVLSPAAYRVDDARWLVRIDGSAWPASNDWTKPSGPLAASDQLGTWEVTLTWGSDPPPDGVYAATVLAGELALAALNSDKCRLPTRVQSLARQGTSMLLVDPMLLLEGRRWGIQEVDMFVAAANPGGLIQPAAILSPDLPRAIRRAGTAPGS